MKRRWIISLAVVLAAAVILEIAKNSATNRVPVYQGETAQQWLREILGTNQMQAFKAFREMGSNALPVIVRAFEKQDRPWDRFFQELYPKLPLALITRVSRPMPDQMRWIAAELAAVNVGYAKAAVPDLTRLLAEGNPKRQLFVLATLINFVGPEDTNSVATLNKCLDSPDFMIAADAAFGLERIGPPARSAIPTLIRLTHSSHPDVRHSARDALEKIDPKNAANYEKP